MTEAIDAALNALEASEYNASDGSEKRRLVDAARDALGDMVASMAAMKGRLDVVERQFGEVSAVLDLGRTYHEAGRAAQIIARELAQHRADAASATLDIRATIAKMRIDVLTRGEVVRVLQALIVSNGDRSLESAVRVFSEMKVGQ